MEISIVALLIPACYYLNFVEVFKQRKMLKLELHLNLYFISNISNSMGMKSMPDYKFKLVKNKIKDD